MRSCREISELVSQSLDRDLSLRERLAVRLHLMLCSRCAKFKKQMLFMRKAAGRYANNLETRLGKK
jgi:hypothetical protein